MGHAGPRVTISRGSESWGRRLGTQTERLIFEADKPGSPPLEVGRRGSTEDGRGGGLVDHFPSRPERGGREDDRSPGRYHRHSSEQVALEEQQARQKHSRREQPDEQRRLEHEDPWGTRERLNSRSERVATSGRDFQRTQTLEPLTEGRMAEHDETGGARSTRRREKEGKESEDSIYGLARGFGGGGERGSRGGNGRGEMVRPDGALDQRAPSMAEEGEFDMGPPSQGSSQSPGAASFGGLEDQLARMERDNQSLRSENQNLRDENEDLRSQVKALTMALQEAQHDGRGGHRRG